MLYNFSATKNRSNEVTIQVQMKFTLFLQCQFIISSNSLSHAVAKVNLSSFIIVTLVFTLSIQKNVILITKLNNISALDPLSTQFTLKSKSFTGKD